MGNNVRIGYISQDTLTDNSEESIIDYITKDSSSVDYSMIFTMLDKFGISYEDKDKKIFNFISRRENKSKLSKTCT
ncbi:MAG: hypothetical protein L6V81_07250 [Clostridium sp.]|nr:MAG: hypothetical protein L6V81_07250 [Clostridium sp.]